MSGLWIVVGDSNGQSPCIATSGNGSIWTPRVPNNFFNGDGHQANAVATNGTWIVAVGTHIGQSRDGVNWTKCINPMNRNANCIAWNGSMWVAGSNTLAYSTDVSGYSWTLANNNPLKQVYGVAWSSQVNLWMAVGSSADNTKCTITSQNGKDWYNTSSNPFNMSNTATDVIGYCVQWYDDGYNTFWLVGGQGADGNALFYNPDTVGNNWFSVADSSSDPFSSGVCHALSYRNNTLVASGIDSTGTGIVAYGSDYTALNLASGISFTGPVQGIGYNGSYWAVTGANNGYTVATTTDFNTWSTFTPFDSVFGGGTWYGGGYGIVWSPVYTENPSCFFANAPVLTPSGYRRIDSLSIGDEVMTRDGIKTIKKIFCKSYTPSESTNPFLIPKGSYSAIEDLLISPGHRVAVDGKMIHARDLGLEQKAQEEIKYYNLGLSSYSNINVAGVEVESFAPTYNLTVTMDQFEAFLKKSGKSITDFKHNINGNMVSFSAVPC